MWSQQSPDPISHVNLMKSLHLGYPARCCEITTRSLSNKNRRSMKANHSTVCSFLPFWTSTSGSGFAAPNPVHYFIVKEEAIKERWHGSPGECSWFRAVCPDHGRTSRSRYGQARLLSMSASQHSLMVSPAWIDRPRAALWDEPLPHKHARALAPDLLRVPVMEKRGRKMAIRTLRWPLVFAGVAVMSLSVNASLVLTH